MKHRVTLTDEELEALEGRLVPISAEDYDLHTFAILRSLYGRFTWLRMRSKDSFKSSKIPK